MSVKNTLTKPFIIMLFGFPGSGKTGFAKQFAENLGIAHLQEDRIASELFGERQPGDDPALKRMMHYVTKEFLRAGVPVVYDADVPRLQDRRELREIAKQHKAGAVLVWLQVDAETAFARTQGRDRRKAEDKYAKAYTPTVFQSVLGAMQNPSHEDYVVISGKHTFHTQRNAVMKKLYEQGIVTPEEATQGMVKPELVNIVPQLSLGGSQEIPRRNISIR
jgi:predicted kinase